MTKLLGIVLVILGILWVARPETLRGYIKKRLNRKMILTTCWIILLLGVFMIASVIRLPGILAKILGIFGVLAIIKGIILMASKATTKLWEWWMEQPLWLFRVQAVFVIIIGIMLILV